MKPNFSIIRETADLVLIRDNGPWHLHMTVTNGVEEVVADLAVIMNGRSLEYIDSEGSHDQIIYKGNKFIRFAPVS